MHWKLEDEHFLVFVGNGYDVNLRLLWNADALVKWVCHLQQKNWATPAVIDEFFAKASLWMRLTSENRHDRSLES